MNIVFTVCSRNTLPNALVLAESVIAYQPGAQFYLCWVDSQPLPVLPAEIQVLTIEEISIPDWSGMCQRYYDFELIAACRPWFAKFLIHRERIDLLTFFSPTTWLLNSFDKLVTPKADLYLTPNITGPLPKNGNLDDKRILNIGMFNSGAWMLRKSEETERFLEWWSERTIDRAKFDLCNGMCMDQLWLNFAPVWIPETRQLAFSEWHYGLRSIPGHKLTEKNGRYEVADKELISADFSGLSTFDPVWSDHITLQTLSATFGGLLKLYQQKLEGYPSAYANENISGYGIVSDISKRRLFRKNAVRKLERVTDFIDQF